MLAFDTANEVIAIGVGIADASCCSIEMVASAEVAAHRASNTQLLPRIDALLSSHGIAQGDIACVVCGRGPGSFTGVRIAMATAKGMASALEVGLIGVSSLDAVAWNAHAAGVRGDLAVIADAMRKEVYPVRYGLEDGGIQRLGPDRVAKAEAEAEKLAGQTALVRPGSTMLQASARPGASPLPTPSHSTETSLLLAGDALDKYGDLFSPYGVFLDKALWTPTGRGLLLAVQAAWREGAADPLDARRHDPAFALPVYTRLSDAEENERIRLSKNDPKNLEAGVQDVALRRDQRARLHDTAILNARPAVDGLVYKPLDAAHASAVARLEEQVMGSDAWSEALVADELPRGDRTWWAAFDGDVLVGYAGGWVVDGQVQILKVGVDPAHRRRGVARGLLARVAADARDLGASTCSLEVRVGNAGARSLYEALGFRSLGERPRYYSDGEDALIMEGPLPVSAHDVAGMELQVDEARDAAAFSAAATAGASEDSEASPASNLPAQLSGGSASAPMSRTDAPRGASVPDEGSGQASTSSAAVRPSSPADASTSITHPLVFAIESSCDETAAALVDGAGYLVADVVASQIDFHARFGGVVPEIASRKHVEAICGVCDECFDVAAKNLGVSQLAWRDLDAVAVTYAPGLMGALVVGVAFAKGAAWGADKPFIGVHHLEGHLYANKLGEPGFVPPAVVSLVSGGNTLLVHMKDWGEYETLGSTIDDAVGEAFDKVAKALGLGYPGGPVISRFAAEGDPRAIPFPRAMMHSGDFRFSLSGLKTAVVTYINRERDAGRELNVPDIAASFQQAVVDVQVKKGEAALRKTGAPTFCLGGGVAANPVLRAAYEEMCSRLGVRLVMPPLSACGDNAGMIALVALDRYRQGRFFGLDADALAHADLDKPY